MRRRQRLGWFAVAVAGYVLAALVLASSFRNHAQRVTSFSRQTVPVLAPAAITVVPGVHLLGALSPSAAYAVATSRGLVLVDSGLKPDARLLKEQMERLGLNWRELRAILLTHAHGDHCGGAEQLRAVTGAKVYAGRGDAAVLRAGEPREAFFSTFYMPEDTPHPTAVDVELDGGEQLDFGDTRFQVLATPGHTPGSTCYLLE